MHADYSAAEIARIGQGLADRSLPRAEWTHRAHFAAAFWLLRHPALEAWHDMPALIRAYNEAAGVPNTDTSGYHATITLASLRAASAWLVAQPDDGLETSLAAFLRGPCGRSDWLLQYWSRERLFSPAARRAWADPNLAALPF
ncbi:MAG: hypothetical protein JSR54_10295 [Proteobacteria bacterium]|nr:hypothetical protein [Pseudomonadota bacterium]